MQANTPIMLPKITVLALIFFRYTLPCHSHRLFMAICFSSLYTTRTTTTSIPLFTTQQLTTAGQNTPIHQTQNPRVEPDSPSLPSTPTTPHNPPNNREESKNNTIRAGDRYQGTCATQDPGLREQHRPRPNHLGNWDIRPKQLQDSR